MGEKPSPCLSRYPCTTQRDKGDQDKQKEGRTGSGSRRRRGRRRCLLIPLPPSSGMLEWEGEVR